MMLLSHFTLVTFKNRYFCPDTFVDFSVSKNSFLQKNYINKMRATKYHGDSAHRLRCFLTNHFAKFLQDWIKTWRVGALRVNTRSSHQKCSIKKVFVKISQNSWENTCGSFLIKLQALGL